MSQEDMFRHRESSGGREPGGAPTGDGAGLDSLRSRFDDLLAAGDEAIDRALPMDADRLLRLTRQSGGQ